MSYLLVPSPKGARSCSVIGNIQIPYKVCIEESIKEVRSSRTLLLMILGWSNISNYYSTLNLDKKKL
jgi:hypothetical protein